ncbi:MAG: DNA polymerase III subunit beta [Puniceicoccales bacterium]|nr:DNA polymerase III subunit beta [Puniceicoccales bacterium]
MDGEAMKFSANKEVLCNSLHAVSGGVGVGQSMAILANVLLRVADGVLELATTNIDFAMGCTAQCAVSADGSATLPAKKLATLCRAIESSTIDFELLPAGNLVRISGGGSLFRMASLPAADFPSLPDVQWAGGAKLSADGLGKCIGLVDYAQSRDEHRPVLNGIFFQFSDDSLSLVATDGRRLAKCTTACVGGDYFFVLPARSCAELSKLLCGGEELCACFANGQASFAIAYGGGGVRRSWLVSKVMEGKYPDYGQVIPSAPEHRLLLQREAFLSALQRGAIMGSGSAAAVRMKFSENLVEISASSGEFGDSYERVAAISPGQKPVEISFNPRYLMEPLRAIGEAEVAFELRNSLGAGVIRTSDNFLCVVMPLRTG